MIYHGGITNKLTSTTTHTFYIDMYSVFTYTLVRDEFGLPGRGRNNVSCDVNPES